MSRRHLAPIVLVVAIAATVVPAVESLPLGPTVTPMSITTEVRSYPVRDLAGNVLGSQAWRIVNDTGNCCENQIATTNDGRILDFGGGELLVGSNDGLRWEAVRTFIQIGAEGAVTQAPNGDIVGVTWDAYGGDRISAIKYDAAAQTWESSLVALHRPFYDRPWISIAQGPFVVGDAEYPYAVIVASNYLEGGGLGLSTLVSLDGLTYLPSARNIDLVMSGPQTNLSQPALAWADWVQPAGHMRVSPLPGGGAIATNGCPWDRLDLDLEWRCATPQGGAGNLPQTARYDSLGRLHVLRIDTTQERLLYRMSTDGGATWRQTIIPRLDNGDIEASDMADFVVSGVHDRALVALRYADASARDHIVVVRLDQLSAAQPTIDVMQVGLGDRDLGNALGGTDRMDFVGIAMLPDGRAVTSFADSLHHPPVIAVELA